MIGSDVRLSSGVVIHHPDQVNLYECTIGDGAKIVSFLEIQKGVVIDRTVQVEAFAFMPSGVTIGDGAFIGSSTARPLEETRAGEADAVQTGAVQSARAISGARSTWGCVVCAGSLNKQDDDRWELFRPASQWGRGAVA